MSYYKECDYCKDTLDPGEKCQCEGAKQARRELLGAAEEDEDGKQQERSA